MSGAESSESALHLPHTGLATVLNQTLVRNVLPRLEHQGKTLIMEGSICPKVWLFGSNLGVRNNDAVSKDTSKVLKVGIHFTHEVWVLILTSYKYH